MASKEVLKHLRCLAGLSPRPTRSFSPRIVCYPYPPSAPSRPSDQNQQPARRCMATVTEPPAVDTSQPQIMTYSSDPGLTTSAVPSVSPNLAQPPTTVLATIYSFPNMEPLNFAYYPTQYLFLPLRKDLLHRAVVYEGDRARQGTANTKWRDEVHGSHRKVHPQKGTGKARAGDKQSPIRRGGGAAFGPKPRNFATGLPRKVYDIAWRTALSFRYRRGDLIIVDEFKNPKTSAPHWMEQIFEQNGLGNTDKRSLLVAAQRDSRNKKLFEGVQSAGQHGRMSTVDDVDVKDVLSLGRVVIEYEALNEILKRHSRDLIPPYEVFDNTNSASQQPLDST